MAVISLDNIQAITRRALVQHGAGDAAAAAVARAVRVAEGYGDRASGLDYLAISCRQLDTGRVDGKVRPKVITTRPGAIRVDGELGFAHAAFTAGFDQAIGAARSNGICGYSVEHTHACPSLGYLTDQLAEAGMIGIGTTNGSPEVTPPGGRRPLLGVNPVAVAVPDGVGGVAFRFNHDTGRAGEAPAGTDPDPGTDPTDGNQLGFLLGLLVEVLASALTGGRASVDVPTLDSPYGQPHDLGQFFLIIDPGAYAADGFHRTVVNLMTAIASQPGPSLPGTASLVTDPVDIPNELWDLVTALAGTA